MYLMRTPAPFADESPRGYFCRLSEENGYESSDSLAHLLGTTANRVASSGWDYLQLRLAVGPLCPIPDSFGYRAPGKVTREGGQLLGHAIHLRHIGLQKARVCAPCLEELIYVPSLWDLKAFIACPTHGTLMIRRCLECGKYLPYARPGLLVCRCGFDLRRLPILQAPSSLAALSELIDAIVSHDSSRTLLANVQGMPVADLLSMDLEVLLRLLVMMCLVELESSGHQSWPCKEEDLAGALPIVAEVFCDWPLRFHLFCAKWHRSVLSHRSEKDFVSTFDWLTIRLGKNLGERRRQTAFLLREARRYGAKNWRTCAAAVRWAPAGDDEQRFGTLADAARVLDIPGYKARRLAKRGVLRGVGATDRRVPVDLDALRQTRLSRHLCEARTVGAEIGVPCVVGVELVRQKLIPIAHATGRARGTPREDIIAYRDALLDRARGSTTLPVLTLGRLFRAELSKEVKVRLLYSIYRGEIPVYGERPNAVGALELTAEWLRDKVGSRALGRQRIPLALVRDWIGLNIYELPAVMKRLKVRHSKLGMSLEGIRAVMRFLDLYVPVRHAFRDVEINMNVIHRALAAKRYAGILRLPVGKPRGGCRSDCASTFVKKSGVERLYSQLRSAL